ncbi:hypothetical protein LTR96_001148 [Exophiala xenobiotica]|nr:hypothetical protein LTR96_001148 [Exophiala xenobiotica]KAK5560507.1 hypothetical protein LTR46_000815 [Exophiala xenobiotica]
MKGSNEGRYLRYPRETAFIIYVDDIRHSRTKMTSARLPESQRALRQLVYAAPLTVETVPTPQPTPGSAIVKILFANVISYMGRIYNGQRFYSYPTPFIPGFAAIGRIAALGPDSVALKHGQLVFVDCTIRGRDDPGAIILSGISDGHSEGARKLMAGEWRNSTYAEYTKVPLENCLPLNESVLIGSGSDAALGYEVAQLAYISTLLVAYGGLRDIRLEAGETIIIAPATGGFGGAAVLCALAMGARVIAMGRDVDALSKLKALGKRVEIVKLTNNPEQDMAALAKFGQADAYFDISPREAVGTTHIKSCILSLRHRGRVSFMGGLLEDTPLPLRTMMLKDLKLSGKWMYSRDDVVLLIKMIEIGLLSLKGVSVKGKFPLELWQEAFDEADKYNKAEEMVLLQPGAATDPSI